MTRQVLIISKPLERGLQILLISENQTFCGFQDLGCRRVIHYKPYTLKPRNNHLPLAWKGIWNLWSVWSYWWSDFFINYIGWIILKFKWLFCSSSNNSSPNNTHLRSSLSNSMSTFYNSPQSVRKANLLSPVPHRSNKNNSVQRKFHKKRFSRMLIRVCFVFVNSKVFRKNANRQNLIRNPLALQNQILLKFWGLFPN